MWAPLAGGCRQKALCIAAQQRRLQHSESNTCSNDLQQLLGIATVSSRSGSCLAVCMRAGALKACASPRSAECSRFSAAMQTLTSSDSLVWLRDYVKQPERKFCPGLQKVLQAFAVKRMVVGHNVMEDGHIRSKCSGALQLADVGMSRAYYSNLAVWTCDHDVPEALYRNSRATLPLSTVQTAKQKQIEFHDAALSL